MPAGARPGTSIFEKALLSGGEGRFRLELSPLAEGSERELARALLGGGASEEIVSAISEGVDGNPLFTEERVTSLLETKALRRRDEGGWRLDLGRAWAGAGSAGPTGPRSCRPTRPGASRSRDCRLGTGARVLLERFWRP